MRTTFRCRNQTDNAFVLKSDDVKKDNLTSHNNILQSNFRTFQPADVSTETGTITIANHGFSNGNEIEFQRDPDDIDGELPGGLSEESTFFVVGVTTHTFKVSASENGAALTFTSHGSGTQRCWGNRCRIRDDDPRFDIGIGDKAATHEKLGTVTRVKCKCLTTCPIRLPDRH